MPKYNNVQGISMLEALKTQNVKLKYKDTIKNTNNLTVVVLKSGDVFVFKYSTSPPPNYDKMKSLKLITGDKIDGQLLERVQNIISKGKESKTFIKTTQGKLFV